MEKPGRILIVDDDNQIRKVLQTKLRLEGYYVETADSAKIGIKKTDKSQFNVVIINVRSPEPNGTKQFTKTLKTKPGICQVIVKWHPTLQNITAKENNSAYSDLLKYDVETILAAVRYQLRKQSKEKKCTDEKIDMFVETRITELRAEIDEARVQT